MIDSINGAVVESGSASEAMQVAGLYAGRDEIITRLSWDCLVRPASPALPVDARQALESRVIASEKIVATDIVRARGPRRPADRPATRMAT